ncbi:MAG: CvpA family protein [Bacteroidota bacterium]
MTIDIILLVIAVWAIYRGWSKGLVMSVFELLSYAVALFLALKCSGMVEEELKKQMNDDSSWLSLIAFLLTLLLGIIGVQFVGKIIEKSLEVIFLGTANKIMGVVVNLVLWVSLYAAVLAFLVRFGWNRAKNNDAQSLDYLLNWGQWLIGLYGQ